MKVVAVIHPTSLLARELRERLEARPDLCGELRLLSDNDEEVGTLTESAGAAALVARLGPDSLEGVDLAFVLGDIERVRASLGQLPRGLPAVLLSPGATEEDAPAAVAGVHVEGLVGRERVASPHPAAIAVSLLVDALGPLKPRRAAATVLLPVSMLGDAGIEELFEQTRGILAFSGAASRAKLFPAQIAFNLLPAEEDGAGVADAARRALAGTVELAIQLVQGGVFHGLAVSLRVEIGVGADAAAVRRQLARGHAIELARDPRRVGPVAVAGSENLLVGAVRAGDTPSSFWIWAVMDNLVRGGALNALELGEALIGRARPS